MSLKSQLPTNPSSLPVAPQRLQAQIWKLHKYNQKQCKTQLNLFNKAHYTQFIIHSTSLPPNITETQFILPSTDYTHDFLQQLILVQHCLNFRSLLTHGLFFLIQYSNANFFLMTFLVFSLALLIRVWYIMHIQNIYWLTVDLISRASSQ